MSSQCRAIQLYIAKRWLFLLGFFGNLFPPFSFSYFFFFFVFAISLGEWVLSVVK